MVRPEGGGVVDELIASVRSNVDVARDAMKAPVNDDSHAIVSDLMLEIKQSQEQLQRKASEMVESGRFENTNEIFGTIDLVTNLEPEFEKWSKRDVPLSPGGDALSDDGIKKKKKKKKKSKREDGWENVPPQILQPPVVGGLGESSWDAFPAPPGESGVTPVVAPVDSLVAAPSVAAPALPANTETNPLPASGRITLGMTWETIGPLLGDPGSSDEARKAKLGELITEAIANECGITLDRIRITSIS
jgi:hypothetical protein